MLSDSVHCAAVQQPHGQMYNLFVFLMHGMVAFMTIDHAFTAGPIVVYIVLSIAVFNSHIISKHWNEIKSYITGTDSSKVPPAVELAEIEINTAFEGGGTPMSRAPLELKEDESLSPTLSVRNGLRLVEYRNKNFFKSQQPEKADVDKSVQHAPTCTQLTDLPARNSDHLKRIVSRSGKPRKADVEPETKLKTVQSELNTLVGNFTNITVRNRDYFGRLNPGDSAYPSPQLHVEPGTISETEQPPLKELLARNKEYFRSHCTNSPPESSRLEQLKGSARKRDQDWRNMQRRHASEREMLSGSARIVDQPSVSTEAESARSRSSTLPPEHESRPKKRERHHDTKREKSRVLEL